jgi:hypothetical protein
MRVSTMIPVNKICAMLCIALALVFAGASLASAVDRMQHGPGGSPTHEHMLFSDISLEDAHEDHHQPDQGNEDPTDRLAGSHHHGDSGSGLIILASADATVAALVDEAHGLAPDRPVLGFRIQGPERPPKPSTISA